MGKKKEFDIPNFLSRYISIFLCSVSPVQLSLESDLYPALVSRRIALEVGEKVSDIVPRMSVQTSPQSLLIEIMGNQTNGTSKNEEAIEDTHLPIMLAGFWVSH